jgi:hypothetical protein
VMFRCAENLFSGRTSLRSWSSMDGILKHTCCRGHISNRYPLSDFTGASMRRPEVLFTSLRTDFDSLLQKGARSQPKSKVLRRSCRLILLIIGTIWSQIGCSFVPRARHLYAGGGRFWRLLRVHYHTGQSQKQYKVQPGRIAKP